MLWRDASVNGPVNIIRRGVVAVFVSGRFDGDVPVTTDTEHYCLRCAHGEQQHQPGPAKQADNGFLPRMLGHRHQSPPFACIVHLAGGPYAPPATLFYGRGAVSFNVQCGGCRAERTRPAARFGLDSARGKTDNQMC